MKFSDFRITRKLAVGFAAVLGVVAVSSAVTVFNVVQVVEIERLDAASSDAQDTLDKVRGDLESSRAAVRKLVLTGSESDRARAQQGLDALHGHLATLRVAFTKEDPDLLPGLADYTAKVDAYLKNAVEQEMVLSADPATRPQALALVTSSASAPLAVAVDVAFADLYKPVSTWSDSWTAKGNAAMARIQVVVIVSAVFSLLVGAFMAWIIGRVIGRPLGMMTESMGRLAAGDHAISIGGLQQRDEIGQMARAVEVFRQAAIEKTRLEREAEDAERAAEAARARSEAERSRIAQEQARVVQSLADGLEQLSEGNLVHRIEQRFAGEYEKLRTDFNRAMEKLQDAIQVVASNTAGIRSGAGEIGTASDDLARRTEQQAASLEQTAAALDQITATVKKSSESATHAKTIVSQAKTNAEHSGGVVRRAVSAMSAIETSAQKVSQIIGVIDEIAFQTNLLALNAGVEAARAGEAGRGFAVVASEVRGLAQRSAEAAKEIKALISESGRQVAEGVDLVGETGTVLERIVVQVAEIDGIVGDITTSAREQATALQEVNTAVNQMDQVTQQNAAMVEETTAASHSLAGEAEELARLISRFALGRAHEPAARPSPRVQAAPASRHGSALAVAVASAPAPESWEEF